MEEIRNILGINTAPAFDFVAWEKQKAESYNAEAGHLNEKDGYDCPICKNKGDMMTVEVVDGWARPRMRECKCMAMRYTIARMKRSGLQNIITECTFEKYEELDPWHKDVKQRAKAYAAAPSGWFFMGGQSGAGKSHLCTAICRTFLLRGEQVQYMMWVDDAAKLKGIVNEGDEYVREVDRFKKSPVLYIDDLFKVQNDNGQNRGKPTPADVRLAFEIINYRVVSKLPTIISSEFTLGELVDLDQAVAGRIAEMAEFNAINITPDIKKNYRLSKVVTV
jgi:DNA replication protein DnaC